MLIIQKMDMAKLSANEKRIKQYILDHQDTFYKLSIKELASQIYVSPALLVAFC